MNNLDYFVYFIYVIKILFILFAITHLILKFKHKVNTKLYKNIVFLKKRFEFIFVFCMAILLIYVFNSKHNKNDANREDVRFLLYLFGFILLIDADWKTYIGDSYLLQKVRDIFGD